MPPPANPAALGMVSTSPVPDHPRRAGHALSRVSQQLIEKPCGYPGNGGFLNRIVPSFVLREVIDDIWVRLQSRECKVLLKDGQTETRSCTACQRLVNDGIDLTRRHNEQGKIHVYISQNKVPAASRILKRAIRRGESSRTMLKDLVRTASGKFKSREPWADEELDIANLVGSEVVHACCTLSPE